MNELDVMSKQKKISEESAEPTKGFSDSTSPDLENTALRTNVKKEINGPKGLEPTRYGDWESKGRCYDF